ncbi:hypothetical protein B484DRAFT_330379 [Ochromonadaceae sp. CCMP2298]|nr:hypothetical protein B484DRAFT_330379 [Ochromonadaceae sp. CCMP2298]
MVLDDYIFTTLGKYLCESPKISYEAFKVISSVAPPSANKYFTAKQFLLFPRDENRCIDSEEFVRYIERSMQIESTILNLMDVVPPGSDPLTTTVTEQQLESFLLQLIPEIDLFSRMHESFYEYYVYTASQKFLFFLDPRRANLLPIHKVAYSGIMQELLDLRQLGRARAELDSKTVEAQLQKNWFSDTNAVRLYSLFLELDRDQNGMLTIEEVAEFAGLSPKRRINLTPVAWARIFEEYITYQPLEMDYKCFLNLVLAVDNMSHPAALRYFWKVLDFDQSGLLSPVKIKYFYNAIYESLSPTYDCPTPEHVVIEVLDILGCNNPQGATLKQLVDSKQGHLVVSMLLDVNGFWRYDNRESLVGEEEDEDEEVDNEEVEVNGGANCGAKVATELNENYDDSFDDEADQEPEEPSS